ANAPLFREAQQVVLALRVAPALERPDRALAQRLARIRDREAVVDADRPPEAAARLARADRRVERERVRDRVGVRDVAVGTMQRRREPEHRRRLVEQPDGDAPRAELQRGLEILDEPRAVVLAEDEPVLHDLDAAAAALRDARIALPGQIRLDLPGAEAPRSAHGEREPDPRPLPGRDEAPLERFANRLRGVAPDRLAAALAVQGRGAREQQLQ